MTDSRDVVLGLAVGGAELGLSLGRVALTPARLAARAPLVSRLLCRMSGDLAYQGALARARLEVHSDVLARSVARALAERHVVEHVAGEMLAVADVDGIVAAVLEHERTQQALERALLSPGLERLLVQVLESGLVDELTERVLASPELERVVDFVATSPQVLDVVTRQTQSLADEMASGVRTRAQAADDLAERTVRGWLRRPRPQPA